MEHRMYADLTDAELAELAEQVYGQTMRAYDISNGIMNQMQAAVYPSPAYAELKAANAVAVAAAREQHGLYREVRAVQAARRQAAGFDLGTEDNARQANGD